MTQSLFILACIAGLVPDLIRILAKAKKDEMADVAKAKGSYLTSGVIQVILGGVAAYVVEPKDKVTAFCVGYAAPQLLTNTANAFLASKTKEEGDGEGFRGEEEEKQKHAQKEKNFGQRLVDLWHL